MLKKLIAALSVLVLMFSFSACKEEKSGLPETEDTTTTTGIATTKMKETVGESSTKPTASQTTKIVTNTEPTASQTTKIVTNTEPTEKTTKWQTTTVLPTYREDYKTSLDKPDKLVLYNKGKTEKVFSNQATKITAQINICLNDTQIAVLKLAVSEDMIEKIKSENKAIELIYDSEQTYVLFQKTGGPNEYKFEKLLIPLDGERKGYVFFCKEGTYQDGPLKSLDSKGCIEKITSILNNR